MADLVTDLRGMIDDTGAAVWTDDQLQTEMERYQVRVWREPLAYDLTYTSGSTYVYTEYRSRFENYESGGTGYFKVEDAQGSARGPADYTVDYRRGVITMSADQLGTALYLTGYSYDLNGAAATLWRQRAGKVSSYYNVSFDGQQLSRSQWFTHCKMMADEYAQQARAITVRQWTVGNYEHE